MRLQASLEFTLILSTVSVLALAIIMMYSKGIGSAKATLNLFNLRNPVNQSQPQNASLRDNPQASVYVPINSTLFSQNPMDINIYGCKKGSATVDLASNTVVFSRSSIGGNVGGILLLSDFFEPILPGANKIDVSYRISCNGANLSSSEVFTTYSLKKSFQNASLVAYITNRNESTDYGITNPAQVVVLSESSHCAYSNVWTGRVYTVPGQCGTSNAWDYFVFNYQCGAPYWTSSRVYCIVPVSSGYNMSGTDPANHAYSYSFDLSIYTPVGLLVSSISSARRFSAISLGGLDVGNASISSVYGTPRITSTEFLQSQNGTWTANNTAVTAYTEAMNSAFPILKYYNSSSVSSQQSSIQEAITSFNDSSRSLIASRRSTNGTSSCQIERGSYRCRAVYPFSYTINISLSRSVGIPNTTLYYSGSVIGIRGLG